MKKYSLIVGYLLIFASLYLFITIHVDGDYNQLIESYGTELIIGFVICILIGCALILFSESKEAKGKEEGNIEKLEINDNELKFKSMKQKLLSLYKEGVLTEDEFKNKVDNLERKRRGNVEDKVEYQQLKNLYKLGILNKIEFETKVESLSKNF